MSAAATFAPPAPGAGLVGFFAHLALLPVPRPKDVRMGARRVDWAGIAIGYQLMGVRSFVVEAPL